MRIRVDIDAEDKSIMIDELPLELSYSITYELKQIGGYNYNGEFKIKVENVVISLRKGES